MGLVYTFPEDNLKTLLSGLSAIDHKKLDIHDIESAYRFIKSYGFDMNDAGDTEDVWYYHRKAVSLLREHLMEAGEVIPEELADPVKLQDVGQLLICASQTGRPAIQRWACAILRVMHAFIHIQNDIFSQFSDQIQEQVLRRYKEYILEDPIMGITLGNQKCIDQISLQKFEIKPFKRTSSSVIKLLSKPHAVAFTLLDRMGVRFVTKTMFDAFRVVRFLVHENIVSLPNVMPDQSNNTLYPANLFMDVIEKMNFLDSPEAVENEMIKRLETADGSGFLVKKNEFSSSDYRFMKFISRQLIEAEVGGKIIHFFFPYEVQIMDYRTHIQNLSGEKAHDEYKKRQKLAARVRVLREELV